MGGLALALPCWLPLQAGEELLEGVLAFLRPLMALESDERVTWILCMLVSVGVVTWAWAGASS